MQRVKEEPREMEAEPTCSYNTESSPDAARAVKQEIDINPSVLPPKDLHYIMMELIKIEPQQMEEDPSCSYNTESSPDAAHAVKLEIDIGPSVLPPTDLHYITMEGIKKEPEQIEEERAFSCNTESSLDEAGAVEQEIDVDSNVCRMEPKVETSNEDTAQCSREASRHNHFVDKETLLEHKKKPRVKSELKGDSFTNINKLKPHMIPQKEHRCEICQKCFAKKKILKRHILTHTGKKDHCCEICEKGFAQKVHLKHHMITHTGQKDHCCEVCQKCFARKEHLKQHMTIHTGQKDYCCEICQKCFAQKIILKKHMLTHTGQKDHCCEICKKFFAQKHHLTNHMITHTGQKDHCCEICQKCFTQRHHLKNHMITHTGQKNTAVNIVKLLK